MKKLLLLLIFLVTIFSVNAMCEDKVACKNQDDFLFCVPSDSSCEYVTYDSDCNQLPSTDSDTDEDGWTDKCDAIPEDISEWIDIDGDSFGYNYDCDDFNFSITDECHDIEINDTETNETDDKDDDNGDSTGGGSNKKYCTPSWDCTDWSDCVDGERTRTCTKTNDCDEDWNKPNEVWGCPLVTEIKLTQKQSPSDDDTQNFIDREPASDTEQNETEDGSLETITGQAFNILDGNFGSGNLLLLLLAILLLFLFFWKRRKKEDEE